MKGLALVCIAAGLWGTVGVANRLMIEEPPLDPALSGLSRTALGGACLLAAAAVAGVRRPVWRWRSARLIVLFGAAGTLFQTCLFAAFDRVGVTVTVAVTVAGPAVLVAIGDWIWHRKPPEAGAGLSIAVAAVGVMVALAGKVESTGQAGFTWDGGGLLLTAAGAFAIVAVAARALGDALHPVHGAGFGLMATAAALLGVVAARRGGFAPLMEVPAQDVVILGYTGVVATGGAYFAFVLGMRASPSATAGIASTLIEPGVAALLAALILGERLSALQGAGCLLMVVAIALLALMGRDARGAKAPDPPRPGS